MFSFLQPIILAMELNPWLFFTTIICVGLSVGSFLNVVIYRLPIMLEREWKSECESFLDICKNNGETTKKDVLFNLSKPDSSCPHCGHKIRFWENIPVLSYIYLKGNCSGCGSHISIQYPLIEAITAGLSIIIAIKFGLSIETLFALIFTWALISLTLIDAKTMLLPDNITLPLLWLGLLVNASELYTDIYSAIYGAVIGYLILWLVYQIFKRITGKEGMGFGDFKLLAALGAWMGWQMLPQIILLSSLVGMVIGLAMIFFKNRNKSSPIPFGPYLAIAGWIAFIWGAEINHLWLNIN